MNRLPLLALAMKCRTHADEFAFAAQTALRTAEQLETVVCFGTDEDVAEALKLAAVIPEPYGNVQDSGSQSGEKSSP